MFIECKPDLKDRVAFFGVGAVVVTLKAVGEFVVVAGAADPFHCFVVDSWLPSVRKF